MTTKTLVSLGLLAVGAVFVAAIVCEWTTHTAIALICGLVFLTGAGLNAVGMFDRRSK